MLARVCYALLNKKRGESLWNSKNRLIFSIAEYSAICTRFSFALWKLLPVQIAFFSSLPFQNSPDFSLISKLPEILPVVFRHIPASAEFGSLLKNVSRVLIRCWKQGGRADEGWLFASLSVKSVCCLAEPVKQRVGEAGRSDGKAFSIFVLYMMRIEFVKLPILLTIAIAAIAASPYGSAALLSAIIATDATLCLHSEGNPPFVIVPSILREGLNDRGLIFTVPMRSDRTKRIMKLTTWLIAVAIAAPDIPSPKTKMNNGSRKRLRIPPVVRPIIE